MTNKKTITWIYNPAKSWDFGFVDIESEGVWYYVHSTNRKNALPWDKVLAELKTFKWKDEAVIKEVLEHSDRIFIWNFQEWKKDKSWKWLSFWFVIIRDENFKKDVFVAWKHIWKAREWELVWVQIISWESWKSPRWKIVEVLWDESKKNLIVDSYILESWFKQKFPRILDRELKNFSEKVDIKKELKNNREDLRKMFSFTIDWEDAKDLDDAISIEKRQNWNIELYVHIADVANYITEKSELDKEALRKSTSVYLVDRVIPMLPKKLSNNLCSLNPDTPKLTLTCEMIIWKDWVIRKSKVYESIIESDFRLTYKEVDAIISWEIKAWDILFWGQKLSEELVFKILDANKLKQRIERNREIKWKLDFEFPETKIILDEDKEVIEISEYPRYDSNKLIELFMVSANESVWKMFSDLPFLHRIHPKPNEEDIARLQKTLNLFNIDFVIKKLDTKEFSRLLWIIEKHPAKVVLEKIVLRSLTKAIYSAENEWHFGLWLDYYSHFTSPIRRYPDLQIHRIIKERISKKLDKKRIKHYESILENIANLCSTGERKAEKLEYKVQDYYICKFYENKIWEEFEASVSWIIPKWIFVALKDTSEWFIELIDKSWFLHNEDLMQFENSENKKIYKLWDKIKVKLIEVDFTNLRLNFELA